MLRHYKTSAGLLLLCLIGTAIADPKPESAGQQALKKAQGVVRQLTEDKQALEAEKATLLEQIKKLEAQATQLPALQNEVVLHKTQEDNLRNNNDTLAAQLKSEQDKQQAIHKKLKEIVAQAKQIQADNQLLVAAVTEREKWIKQCTVKNTDLLKVNQSLLGKYQEKGFWDEVAELEPFTGIGKVESQNNTETYQFKLQDLKVTEYSAGER